MTLGGREGALTTVSNGSAAPASPEPPVTPLALLSHLRAAPACGHRGCGWSGVGRTLDLIGRPLQVLHNLDPVPPLDHGRSPRWPRGDRQDRDDQGPGPGPGHHGVRLQLLGADGLQGTHPGPRRPRGGANRAPAPGGCSPHGPAAPRAQPTDRPTAEPLLAALALLEGRALLSRQACLGEAPRVDSCSPRGLPCPWRWPHPTRLPNFSQHRGLQTERVPLPCVGGLLSEMSRRP